MIKTANITPALIRKVVAPIVLYKRPPVINPIMLARLPILLATPWTTPWVSVPACLDKIDIIFEELEACERLLKYRTDYNIDDDDEFEKKAIESEIAYLKMILDLMP